MNIKGHRSRCYVQYTTRSGNELCTTSGNIQMSTVFDGRNFRMDRVRIVCTDIGGDLFMGDFEWMEETNCVEVGRCSPGVAVAQFSNSRYFMVSLHFHTAWPFKGLGYCVRAPAK